MLIWPKLNFLKCGGHSVFQRSALQSCVPAILRLLESWNRWCHSKPPPQVFHRSSRKLSMADYFQYLSVWREITGREGGRNTSGCLKCAELIRDLLTFGALLASTNLSPGIVWLAAGRYGGNGLMLGNIWFCCYCSAWIKLSIYTLLKEGRKFTNT